MRGTFPVSILTEEILANALRPDRIDDIRRALTGATPSNPITVDYKAPWTDPRVIDAGTVDLIISSSVLEHVVDLPYTYKALYQWLKPGGWMSHQVDLKCHGLTRRWNGFRSCSEGIWNLAAGKRPYLINRHPVSVHLQLMQEAGFKLVTQMKMLRARRNPPRGARAPLGRHFGRGSQLFRPVRHRDEVDVPAADLAMLDLLFRLQAGDHFDIDAVG